MSQYNTLSIKLCNLHLNKLESGIKNGTEVTLKLSTNVVGESNDENNFLYQYFYCMTIIKNWIAFNKKCS